MKCNSRKFLAVGTASLVCAALTTAQAAFINGSITFSGGATLDNDLGSATAFTDISAQVTSATGDYASVVGETAVFTPFTFDPPQSSPFTLWTIKAGEYTFVATGMTVMNQTSAFLNIVGTGHAQITGKTDTAGIWTVTDTGLGQNVVQFGSGADVPVPDGGTTVLMLSAALSGFGLLKKKLS